MWFIFWYSLESCPDKTHHWLILCTVPSTPVVFLPLPTLDWTFALEMRSPLHPLTQLHPACWRGPSKHASDGCQWFSFKCMENMTKQLPPRPFCLDNPRQTAPRCGYPHPAFKPWKNCHPADWTPLYGILFFIFPVCSTDWKIETSKGFMFGLF